MDTRLLRVFQAVARHGGLPGAALELHLTPSALSHRLKGLETELGCRLFERSGRRMVLNQAGEQLLAGIGEPLEALAETATRLKALGRWGQGRLRIGASTTLCGELLPRVIAELRREFARLHLVVESGDLPDLVGRMRDRTIDLAIGVGLDAEPGVEFQPLFEDELLWVLSPEHPWADGRPLSKADLRREPMIAYRRGSPTARLVDRYFRGLGVDPMVAMEVSSVRAIADLVRRNLGVAILAPWALTDELTAGTLTMRPLGAKSLKRHWVLAHPAGRRLTLPEERFHRLMEREAGTLWRDRGSIPLPG